jgi:hypothetical protein
MRVTGVMEPQTSTFFFFFFLFFLFFFFFFFFFVVVVVVFHEKIGQKILVPTLSKLFLLLSLWANYFTFSCGTAEICLPLWKSRGHFIPCRLIAVVAKPQNVTVL